MGYLRPDDGKGRPVAEVLRHHVRLESPQSELGRRRQAGVAGAEHRHAGCSSLAPRRTHRCRLTD